MDSLHILKSTLLKLNKREVNSLITFLNSHRKRSKDEVMKSIQLVKLLLKKKNQTSNEIQRILYGKNNYHAFNKLIIRLRDKILEIIILDLNLLNPEYGKRNAAIFEIRKKSLQSEIMLLRGMTEEYEIFDSLVTTLYTKQRYLGFRLGTSSFQKLKSEIEFYENNRDKSIAARKLCNYLKAKINFSANSFEYQNELNQAVIALKNDYEQTKSSTIGFYYYFLDSVKDQDDIFLMQKKLAHLKEFLTNNPAILTSNRMGDVLVNIGTNEILLFNYENSINYFKDALYFYSGVPVNMISTKEEEFQALFYSNKISQAEKVIEEIYHSSRTTNTPFLYSKRACFFAWIKTFQGDFIRSNELLEDVKEIEKDKEGWSIGVRILTIMNSVELEQYEKADREIGKLKRHYSKTTSTKNIRKRNLVILEVLLELMKQGYDFRKAYKTQLRSFKLLESNREEYCWKIKSPELMIFHEWFKSKTENRPYNHVESILTEKKKFLKRSASSSRKKLHT
jgi:hypothetical protein